MSEDALGHPAAEQMPNEHLWATEGIVYNKKL